MSKTYFDLPHRSSFFTLRSFLFLMVFLVTSAAQAQLPFVTTWQTTTDGESITIPTTGIGYSYTVDWGDGSSDATVYTGDVTHSYAIAGTYTVSISGNFPRISFNNAGDKDKILTIEQWGDQVWTSMNFAFHGCSQLTYNATDLPDLSSVISMNYMFHDCSVFNGDLSGWDVSSVIYMGRMFYNCSVFNGDLSSWDVSSVTNMGSMFSGCSVFNSDLSSWDVNSVTDMEGMFSRCSVFNGDLSSWDVSNVTDMGSMFSGCSVFNGDLSSWDVSNVTDMGGMFINCSVFNY